jgi:hypothetical protein
MELSERERQVLREMETHLLAEDPGLASSLSIRRLRVGVRAIIAAAGLVVGVLLMAVGIGIAHTVGTAVALLGYLVLLFSTSASVDRLRDLRVARGTRPGS